MCPCRRLPPLQNVKLALSLAGGLLAAGLVLPALRLARCQAALAASHRPVALPNVLALAQLLLPLLLSATHLQMFALDDEAQVLPSWTQGLG